MSTKCKHKRCGYFNQFNGDDTYIYECLDCGKVIKKASWVYALETIFIVVLFFAFSAMIILLSYIGK